MATKDALGVWPPGHSRVLVVPQALGLRALLVHLMELMEAKAIKAKCHPVSPLLKSVWTDTLEPKWLAVDTVEGDVRNWLMCASERSDEI